MIERKEVRLTRYDYSLPRYYFVTICVQDRKGVFGCIVGADPCVGPRMDLNAIGEMVRSWWDKLPERFTDIKSDQFVIMPNHIHGIIEICGRTHGSAPTLGTLVQWFKTMTTNEYIRGVKAGDWPSFEKRFWQRGYYEHVIRSEKELLETLEYIANNPKQWHLDPENVQEVVYGHH